MNDPIDFCKYFADIEADPAAVPPRLTVRQFLQAQEHVYGCDACYVRMERVAARQSQQFPERGIN